MTFEEMMTKDIKTAAAADMLRAFVKEVKPDYTSRVYKKFVRVARGGRIRAARKCAIKLGVPASHIDAALTLLEITEWS